MSVPALGIAPVADEKVHSDPTDSLGRSALMTQLTKPADEMLQVKMCSNSLPFFFFAYANGYSGGCRQQRCFFRFVGKEKIVLILLPWFYLFLTAAVWKRFETILSFAHYVFIHIDEVSFFFSNF